MLDPATEAGNFYFRVTLVNVAGLAAVPLCAYDSHRISLMFGFSSGGANQGYVQPYTRFGGPQGLQCYDQLPPLVFSFADHGGIVQQAWFGSCDPVNGQFTVIETMYDPSRQGL